MDPARLRAILAVLNDAGIKRAKVPLWDGHKTGADQPAVESLVLEVEFAEQPEPATPFVGKDGKPLNLDDGAGPLARDPDADLESANFTKRESGG